jgi:hypothetical protein
MIICMCFARLSLSLATLSLGSSPNENNQFPAALLTHSLEISDIRTPDNGSFRLRVRVQVWGALQQLVEGSYLLLCASWQQFQYERHVRAVLSVAQAFAVLAYVSNVRAEWATPDADALDRLFWHAADEAADQVLSVDKNLGVSLLSDLVAACHGGQAAH